MTVRDSRTQARARTPGVEDDPTSTTVRDRALGPTQCGISDVATKCTEGGRRPNICRCMLGAVLSWRCLGRHRLRCQPCSRIGENPPYGMIGGIEETSASSKPDPRLDPTRLRGARDETRVPTAIFLTGLRPTLEDETQVIDSRGVFGCIFFITGASSSRCLAARRPLGRCPYDLSRRIDAAKFGGLACCPV